MKYNKEGRLIWDKGLDPFENLALEEVLFEEGIDCIRIWQNRPSVIVGRNQNTLREVSERYLKEKNIALVRRMTGGGAVYHDLGNLNVSFFFRCEDFERQIHSRIGWIVDFLQSMGVAAVLSGRNDVCVKSPQGDMRKISGWAMMQREQRGLLHGTLLFSGNFVNMEQALTPPTVKMESKGIVSVKSRVANLQEMKSLSLLNMQEFADRLATELKQKGYCDMELSESCKERCKKLAVEKYKSERWTYGRNPQCSVYNQMRFPIGTVELNLELKQNRIQRCEFFGDYMNREPLSELEFRLKGTPYTRNAIFDVLRGVDCKVCLGTEDMEQVLQFFKKGE